MLLPVVVLCSQCTVIIRNVCRLDSAQVEIDIKSGGMIDQLIVYSVYVLKLLPGKGVVFLKVSLKCACGADKCTHIQKS